MTSKSTSSRLPYDGRTPHATDFALSPTITPITLSNSPPPITSSSSSSVPTRIEKWKRRMRKISKRTKETLSNNTGMLFIGGSQFFFALMNVTVKKLNSLDDPVPTFELILVRMAITWVCCVTYMNIMKVPDPFIGPKGVRLLLVTRGFVGFFGLFGVYYSLQYLSLSDATVLTFLAPMCTVVTGAVFLKEGFEWKQVLAGAFSLVGVILIARPEFVFGSSTHDHPLEGMLPPPTNATISTMVAALDVNDDGVTPAQRIRAVGVALLGVCGATGAYTTIRAIGKRAHPLHNLVFFSSQCVIVSSIAILITGTKFIIPTRLDWLAMLLMIGLFGFTSQFLLTMGLQRETVGRGTMAVYVQVIFATTFDRIFFHSSPSPLSILGTTIIMTAAIYVAVTKESTSSQSKKVAAKAEDISLEEGLLANQETFGIGDEDDEEDEDEDGVTASASFSGSLSVDGSDVAELKNVVVPGDSGLEGKETQLER